MSRSVRMEFEDMDYFESKKITWWWQERIEAMFALQQLMVGWSNRSAAGLQSIISVDFWIFRGRRVFEAGRLVEDGRRVIVNSGGVGTETAIQADDHIGPPYLFRTSYNCSTK